MNRMSKSTGNKLTNAVENVIATVSTGSSPTEALYKVAKSNNHNREEIKRIAEAYNQSRTAFTLQEKTSRLDAFPLANPDSVITRLFPDSVASLSEKMHKVSTESWYKNASKNLKIAVSNYTERNRLDSLRSEEKEANDETPDPGTLQKQSEFNKQAKLREELEKTLQQEKTAKNSLTVALFPLKDQLRQCLTGTPFHTIESNLTHYYQKTAGNNITPIMDLIFETAELDKIGHRRALPSDFDLSTYTLSDFSDAGYMTTEDLVKKALDFQKTVAKRASIEAELNEVNEKVAFYEKKDKPFSDFFNPKPINKEAAFPISKVIFGRGIVNNMGGYMDPVRRRTEQEVRTILDELENPEMQRRRQQIKAQVMLNEFMNDDEVISEYDPEEITQAFNEVMNVSPNIVNSRTALQDAMRRYLVDGGLASMEVSQLQELNKNFTGASRSDRLKDVSASNTSSLLFGSGSKGLLDGNQ